MKIGLIDVDRTGFPNLALMKLSAWHKAQGDDVSLLRGEKWLLTVLMFDKVYASAVFSWNRAKAELLASLGVVVGGSGLNLKLRLPPDVEAMPADYALYGLDYGFGFLSRGCIRDCAFCIVPTKDGRPRSVATIADLVNEQWREVTPMRGRDKPLRRPFVVLLDDEFFWNIKWAIARLEEFTVRGIDWCPSQGLDIRCTTPALCDTLAASPFWNVHHSRRQITFAFDDANIERRYRQGVEMLLAAGVKARQLQSFVLVGFDHATKQARGLDAVDHRRIAVIREYGIDPFVMVYRDDDSGQAVTDPALRNFARWINRHLYKVCRFEDYVANLRKAVA